MKMISFSVILIAASIPKSLGAPKDEGSLPISNTERSKFLEVIRKNDVVPELPRKELKDLDMDYLKKVIRREEMLQRTRDEYFVIFSKLGLEEIYRTIRNFKKYDLFMLTLQFILMQALVFLKLLQECHCHSRLIFLICICVLDFYLISKFIN